MTLREFKGVLLLGGGGSCGRSGRRRGRGWARPVEIAEVVGWAERGCWVERCVKLSRCWRKAVEEYGWRDWVWARWKWAEIAERWLGVGLTRARIVAALRWRRS